MDLFENGSLYHIAIAVKNLDSAEKIFKDCIGLKITHREEIQDQGVRATMLQPESGEGTAIELLEALDDDSPIAKFLNKRGEGIHHICFYVDDLEVKLNELKNKGIKLIDEKPRVGAYETKVAFIHPSSMNGVLVELAEKPG
ncbi:MAG: methylmalonyl-CoA epimerase [Thermodesulfobacteriota bacterium]